MPHRPCLEEPSIMCMTGVPSSQATIKSSLNVSLINTFVPTLQLSPEVTGVFPPFKRTGCLEYLEDQALISRYPE